MEIAVAILAVAVVILVVLVAVGRRGTDTAGLRQASEHLVALANERFARQAESNANVLDNKKQLIDQQLQSMKSELEKVSQLVQAWEKDREAKFGELSMHLKAISQQATELTASTQTLREALANPRVRGQWGERMAEDILRLVGLIEGVNYRRQKNIEGGTSRPDFSFLLPNNLTINMDVKFPLENYVRYLETTSEVDRERYREDFLRDVRMRINEVSSREYIDQSQGTVDYVLLFIPNESVYAFIHEQDPSILDVALQKKVVWCSPLTLYAMLSVVRQAVEVFSMEKASQAIISLFGQFDKEWNKFTESMETLGKRLASAQKEFDSLSGTRRRALERPLGKIEALRRQRGIMPAGEEDDGDETAHLFSKGAQLVLPANASASLESEGTEERA